MELLAAAGLFVVLALLAAIPLVVLLHLGGRYLGGRSPDGES